MKRTTIYLPDDMKTQLQLVAAIEGTTEAAVIRAAVAEALDKRTKAAPTIPLFRSRGEAVDWSARTVEMDGFGEQ